MGVLLVLAVVATVLMVVSESRLWTRVGTLAALWSAFIGAVLVARYRRQASTEATRMRDLHTVYELQLEREISARREHELVVEKQLRETVRSENEDSMAALRQEITALREQLSRLTGTPLAADVTAVGGSRAAELGAGPSRTTVPSERVEPRQTPSWVAPTGGSASPEAQAPAGGADFVGGVGRESTPSTDQTSRFSPVTGSTGRRPAVRPSAEQQAASEPTPTSETTARPWAQPTSEPVWHPTPASAESAGDWGRSGSDERHAAGEQQVPRQFAEEHRSRHAEGAGNSVADLLARLGGSSDSAGQAPASGGRRHRRAED